MTHLVGRVPPVQCQRVPVGIGEEGHVADACVQRLANELDPLFLQLGPSGCDVRDPQSDVSLAVMSLNSYPRASGRQIASVTLPASNSLDTCGLCWSSITSR